MDAFAGDFEDAREDFGDREKRGGLLLFTFAFEEFEERCVVGVEVADIDAGFGEAGEEFGDRVGLVKFVEHGASRDSGAGGEFFVGGYFVEKPQVAVGVCVISKRVFVGEIENIFVVPLANADHEFHQVAIGSASRKVVAEVAAVALDRAGVAGE